VTGLPSGVVNGLQLNFNVNSGGALGAGATFTITGVQLERGTTATSFDYRPYGTEFALCQRYYLSAPSNSAVNNASGVYTTLQWPVTMRTSPTTTVSSGTVSNTTNYGAVITSSGATGISYTSSAEL
jgi:hypothetical protein